MTKREAIRECKRFWKEVVESGLSKYDFLGTEAGWKWGAKGYVLDCPLYTYTFFKVKSCKTCPLMLQHGAYCTDLSYSTDPARFYSYVKGLKE